MTFLKNILQTFQQHKYILGLLALAFLLRLGFLLGNNIPFSFDHGKDSLAIMDLVVNLSPKFIGPWTSIPGLYFGPGWYYLLAPFYWLSGFNPVGGAVAMLLLVLLQVFLAYKYLGKYEALIISSAPLWFILSKSAWNPYPMTLVSLILLILLKKSIKTRTLGQWRSFGLGLTASFGFHFSAAFAVFYPVILLLSFFVFRIKIKLKDVLFAALGFIVPFLPQFLFELKYNFSQTRAILAYFQTGESNAISLEKILQVLKTTYGELTLSIMPDSVLLGSLSFPISLTFLAAFGFILIRHIKKSKEISQSATLAILFIGIPVLGFFWLHFNVWYVYAMAPAAVLLVGTLLRKSPIWLRYLYFFLLLLGPVIAYREYFAGDKQKLEVSRGFLPIKIQAIELIQEKANGRAYASYHYVPDIYDFSYQYLYFWKASQGQPLPVEFSYKPGESSYVVQKADLLQHFPAPSGQPEVIFYIVEEPENEEFLARWWGEQRFSNIDETIELSDQVTLYVATP